MKNKRPSSSTPTSVSSLSPRREMRKETRKRHVKSHPNEASLPTEMFRENRRNAGRSSSDGVEKLKLRLLHIPLQAMPFLMCICCGSDDPTNRCSAHSPLSCRASFADGSSTDSIPSIGVLISSAYHIVTKTIMMPSNTSPNTVLNIFLHISNFVN
ncbi:hypothetical protein BLNAU_14570 [Blattamonas nauphoetae]|uniref:Uncharacterized protein n=1 Tax=Blattamonas nauphoetae TaxID=2049346 RepID=A0ABQ9XD73_9EUKA|nr:hypothetical protein BLNAU_14570 [Blattamonas nauphoetae]